MPPDAIKPVQFNRKERRQNARKQKKMSKAKRKKKKEIKSWLKHPNKY